MNNTTIQRSRMPASWVRTDGGRIHTPNERCLSKARSTAGRFIMGQRSSSKETV